MAGVRRVKTKASPATRLGKASKKGVRDLFFRAKALFRRRKGLNFIKRLLRLRSRVFYKSLRLRTFKKRPTFFPKSTSVLPFSNPLRPLLPGWAALGFNLSEHEKLFFSSAKTPSLTTLVRSVSIMEKAALLIYGSVEAPSKKRRALVRGSLGTLIKGASGKAGQGPAQVDGRGLVLNFLSEDGFIEPWLTINLAPLTLTLAVLSTTAKLM